MLRKLQPPYSATASPKLRSSTHVTYFVQLVPTRTSWAHSKQQQQQQQQHAQGGSCLLRPYSPCGDVDDVMEEEARPRALAAGTAAK